MSSLKSTFIGFSHKPPISIDRMVTGPKGQEIRVEVAMQYTDADDERTRAYTNNGYNLEGGTHLSSTYLSLPAADHDRRESIADEIGECAAFAHKSIDSDKQRQTLHRNGRESDQSRSQRYETRAGHAARSFRSEHRDEQQTKLLAQSERSVRSLR